MVSINEQLLDDKLTELEKMRSWSPRVISKLETLIRIGDDYDLFRINPLQYASEKGVSEAEAIDLFLYATKVGLFEMEWHLLCPACGHVVESFAELTRLHTHTSCESCFMDIEVALDDFIQVAFTITKRIRANSFHNPRALPIEDYYLKYCFSKDISPNGTLAIQREMLDTTRLLTYIAAGEKVSTEFDLQPGVLMLVDYTKNPLVMFMVGDQAADQAQHVVIQVSGGQYRAVNQPVGPIEVTTGIFTHKPEQAGQLASGKVLMEVENCTEAPTPLWIRNYPPDPDMKEIQFRPFLSGKRLLTTQTFRELFRSEVIQADEGIGVKDITFLFTDLKGSTAMYDRVGDANAYYLVRQHFDTLGRVIAQNSGAVVKTIGDAVMATFMNPADALKAAVEMLRDIDEFNQGITEDLILKIGIHRGHSIVVTLNDRLDYFGQTVNIASRVQGLADAGEVYITEEAYRYPGVSEIVNGYGITALETDVKGLRSKLKVYKVSDARN